jgi:hypothetical protein
MIVVLEETKVEEFCLRMSGHTEKGVTSATCFRMELGKVIM